MKPTTFAFALCLVLGGCVSLDESSTSISRSPASAKKVINPMTNVKIGMNRQEIAAVMEKELLVGYKFEGSTENSKPITIAQPYREESLTNNGKTYQILFYYTSINRSDDLIADDELTPLIFEGDLLIGKGLSDLDRIKRM